jgi:hypothetical protein
MSPADRYDSTSGSFVAVAEAIIRLQVLDGAVFLEGLKHEIYST